MLHRDALQGTIEAQERDIDELKKSVYELSYMLSMQVRLCRPTSTTWRLMFYLGACRCAISYQTRTTAVVCFVCIYPATLRGQRQRENQIHPPVWLLCFAPTRSLVVIG